MNDRRKQHAQDAFSNSCDPDQQQLVFTLAIIEMTEQLKRIADYLQPASAQAVDSPFDSAQDMSLPRQFDEEEAVLAQAYTEGIDLDALGDDLGEALAEVSEHGCTQTIPPAERDFVICGGCENYEHCNDRISC